MQCHFLTKKIIIYINLTYFGGFIMKDFKKGDIVSRASYNNDILFFIEKIIDTNDRGKIAVLKGVTIRIVADAPISDLEIPSESRINENYNSFNKELEHRANRKEKIYGKILHLDRR